MGDSKSKAKMELEELYLGVPDDSVNLTFQHLAQVKAKAAANQPQPQAQESISFHRTPESISFHHQDDNLSNRKRAGIPHSNICTICCNYIYFYMCRHRCLVCGRVYCRECVTLGMGHMTEGRKCIDCLGRRFSHRYIAKAGNVGCCLRYPTTVKQQELKWAERGPRRSSENRYNNNNNNSTTSVAFSRSRSPMAHYSTSNPPSFVLNSPYAPYSPTNHHPMPF